MSPIAWVDVIWYESTVIVLFHIYSNACLWIIYHVTFNLSSGLKNKCVDKHRNYASRRSMRIPEIHGSKNFTICRKLVNSIYEGVKVAVTMKCHNSGKLFRNTWRCSALTKPENRKWVFCSRNHCLKIVLLNPSRFSFPQKNEFLFSYGTEFIVPLTSCFIKTQYSITLNIVKYHNKLFMNNCPLYK